jgi:LmbE family N-acetylglucosaminyl deacetylase
MDVLAVAVHPDDETLGCGGTLLKLAAEGARIHWLIVTSAQAPAYSEAQVEQQAAQVERVRAGYPFASLRWLKRPTTQLDRLPLGDLVQDLHRAIEEVRPAVLFVPHRADAHSDHRVTHQAVMAATKSFKMPSLGIRRILACEVPSETDAPAPTSADAFLPQVLIDVTATMARKLELMSLYASEVQAGPMPRGLSAIAALARHRGAAIGVEHAEAFMLLREIG